MKHLPENQKRKAPKTFKISKKVNPVRSSHGVLNLVFAKKYEHSSPRQAAGHSASNGVKRSATFRVSSASGGVPSKSTLLSLLAHHILPDFSEAENLVRFATLLYILALLPLIGFLYQPKTPSIPSTQEPAKTYVAQSERVETRVVKTAPRVLGEMLKSLAVPKFPSWKVQYFNGQNMFSPVVEIVQVLHPVVLELDQVKSYPTIDLNNFSARFESMVDFEKGIYRFAGIGAKNYKVYIDGGLVLDGLRESSQNTYVGGGPHKVRVDFYSQGEFVPFSLDWIRQ